MTLRQDDAVPAAMQRAGAIIQQSRIAQIGPGVLDGLLALPVALGGGHAQIDVKNGAQAARAAELDLPNFPGQGIDALGFAPPALALEDGRQLTAELVKGTPLGHGPDQGGVNILQDIKARRLRHSEAGLVNFLPDLGPVAGGDEIEPAPPERRNSFIIGNGGKGGLFDWIRHGGSS